MSLRLPLCLSLFAALATACALEPTTPDDDVTASPSLPLILDDCELCSSNAATISEGILIHDLDLSGLRENDQGVRILRFGFRRGDGSLFELTPRFEQGDKLVATDAAGHRFEYLTNALFEVRVRRAGLTRDYELKILAVDWTSFWTTPRTSHRVPMYKFVAYPAGHPENQVPLCPSRDLGTEWTGLRGQAFLFTGDRFWLDATITDPGPNEPWFNVACVGTAPAKLHLLRHTEASSFPGLRTTRDQRQAMLKLLTADYCHRGTFTEDGWRLQYQDGQSWYLNVHDPIDLSEPTKVEGLWTSSGPYCLNTPRLWDREAVEGVCGEATPPRCDDADIDNWKNHFHRDVIYGISVNP